MNKTLCLLFTCLVSGSLARELAGLSLGNGNKPTGKSAVDDALTMLNFLTARGQDDLEPAFGQLAAQFHPTLCNLTDRAMAGEPQATSVLRLVYDLWRHAFKPQTWRKLNSTITEPQRFGIFLTNLQTILSVNNATSNLPYKASLNAFADMSWDEFKGTMLSPATLRPWREDFVGFAARKLLATAEPGASTAPALTYPAAMDWVKAGKVTPVGFQGQCAAGWVFAAVAALESKLLINLGNASSSATVDLSEQQMLDCVAPKLGLVLDYANCSGGYPADVFSFANTNGTVTERLYPWTGGNSTRCKSEMVAGLLKQRPSEVVHTNPAPGYLRARQGRAGMLAAVAQQPVATFFATEPTFQFYSSGVYNGGTSQYVLMLNGQRAYSLCQGMPNHVVLVTGYNTTAATPYFSIKNSFGGSWGQGGMGQVSIKTGTLGTCSMFQYAYYPTTTETVPAATKSPGRGVLASRSDGDESQVEVTHSESGGQES